jgi:hypothetical protein
MRRDMIQQNHALRKALRETLLDVYTVRKRKPRIKRPTSATATSRPKEYE